MSDHPLRKIAYDQAKRARIARQLAHYHAPASQPIADRARAWFAQWPHRVPKAVWAQMSREEHMAWLALSQSYKLRRMIDRDPTAQPMLLQWRLEGLGRAAAAKHAKALAEVQAALAQIKGPLTLMVHFSVPEFGDPSSTVPTSFAGEYEADASGDWGGSEPGMAIAIALGLAAQGSLVIQQTLPLRTQRHDPDTGEPIWVNQERLYGIGLENGAWQPADAKAVRAARGMNGHTGQQVEVPAGMSFGNLSELLAKRAQRHG